MKRLFLAYTFLFCLISPGGLRFPKLFNRGPIPPTYLMTWTTMQNGVYGIRYAITPTQLQTWMNLDSLGVPVQCSTLINWFSTTAQNNYIALFDAAVIAAGPIPPLPSPLGVSEFEVSVWHPVTGQGLLLMNYGYQNTSPAAMALISLIRQIGGF